MQKVEKEREKRDREKIRQKLQQDKVVADDSPIVFLAIIFYFLVYGSFSSF